jgi:adenosylcobinamide-GDP ribazoletransferase
MNGLLRAFALFTVAPMRLPGELSRAGAVAALRWFPLVGAAVGAAAALPATAVLDRAPHAALLGAVGAVGMLALLTRGLHLDGLADTVDGLGSHRPTEEALSIMRRSDIGAFGVLAIVLVVLVDAAALGSLDERVWRPVAALAVAAATGRLCVLVAAHRRIPAARGEGFGAYVAGSVPTAVLLGETVAVLGFGLGMAQASGAALVGWPVAQLAALIVTSALLLHVRRRLGGVTGDVFGALVEIGTALTLAGLALAG